MHMRNYVRQLLLAIFGSIKSFQDAPAPKGCTGLDLESLAINGWHHEKPAALCSQYLGGHEKHQDDRYDFELWGCHSW